eukprot:MONOS_2221.1-p1 / transcript=MONOS_2221.1 / gene=MONOS_2221 / organism=Monocercomonoides_exilis_PA203 / gene_product=nicotinamide mononucleotide adenylyltransferase 1 / transcript_product=nicotinamide mononucleotide adenylyltransferase 1 / location=Mono_scaffold00044:88474-89400(+) / protein_length=211 / sequence_SO=supercontig / SO=protein_coding / is_pseudo=false
MHFRILEIAKRTLEIKGNYTVLGGIISPIAVTYGKPGLLDGPTRVEMCKLGCLHSSWIGVDDWESVQPAWVRTAVTLEILHERLSKVLLTNDFSIAFVMSMDNLEAMTNPKIWDPAFFPRLFKFKLVCCGREGKKFEEVVEHESLRPYKAQIYKAFEEPRNDISSTFVRELLAHSESVRYLIPDEVASFIEEKQLYKAVEDEKKDETSTQK